MRVSRRNLLATLALGVVAVATPSAAFTTSSTEMPSSSASGMRPWSKMNPSTFQLSHAAVLEQFDRVARIDTRLTVERRVRLGVLLESGGAVEVWVPDGVNLDYLTGRKVGKPFVYERMQKQIGRVDRALLFDLGGGVYLYWFTGTKESCNNIGIVIIVPTVVQQPPVEYTYVMMPQDDLDVFRAQGYIPSVYIRSCCDNAAGVCSGSFFAPGMLLQSGKVDEDPTLVRVRVPKPQ